MNLSRKQAGLHSAGAGADGDEAWAPALLPLAGRGHLLVLACAASNSGVPAGWSAAPRRSGVALLPDLSDATARLLADDVARRRDPGDLVLISLHWGGNWGLELPPDHRAFAHRLVDLGAADIVHGHSSHHPLPIEVYRGKPIFYGCGDLINDYEGIGAHSSLRGDVGCLYFATLSLAGGTLQRLDIVALQRKRLRLVAADRRACAWLAGIFNAGDCRLVPRPGVLPGWSLQWEPQAG